MEEGALFSALSSRAIETAGERIVKRLDPSAALASRDALAKNLYARLFDWLVAAVNRKISALGAGHAAAGGARWGHLVLLQNNFKNENSGMFDGLMINSLLVGPFL